MKRIESQKVKMKGPHKEAFLYPFTRAMLRACGSTGRGSDPSMPTDGRNPAPVMIKLHNITSTEASFRWSRRVERHLDWAGWRPLERGRQAIHDTSGQC